MSDTTSRARRNIVVALILFGFVLFVMVAFRLLIYPMFQQDLIDLTSSGSRYTHEVSIHLDSFSGYAPLRSDTFRQDLASQSIKLDLEDDGADYGARLKALQRGDADMAVFTIDALVTAGHRLGDFPATIVMVIDETRGADAIVAYKDAIPNLKALDDPGARLVLTTDSPSEFLGRIAIAEFGLQRLPARWEARGGSGAVYEEMKKAKRTLKRGYVVWEPNKAQALEDPDVHVLFDSSRISGYIVDVLVANRQFLLDHPDVVENVVGAWLRTTTAYSERENGMVDLVMADADALGEPLSRPLAEKVVAGIAWKNTLENYAHFGIVPAPPEARILHLEDSIANIGGVLVRTGKMAADPLAGRANEVIYTKTLQDLNNKQFHPSSSLGIVDGGRTDALSAAPELPALPDSAWESLTPAGTIQVRPISFARGRAKLNIQSQRDLDELARRLRSLPYFYMTVTGHTRAEGDPDANRTLAQGRADAALSYLQSRGISPNRMRAIAAPPSGTGGQYQSVTFELAQQPY